VRKNKGSSLPKDGYKTRFWTLAFSHIGFIQNPDPGKLRNLNEKLRNEELQLLS
jgi:hypothetical protein